MVLNVGIVGGGYVGSATALFESRSVSVRIYDIDPDRCRPKGTKIEDLIDCDLIFICVPTPSNPDGSCNTKIVESVVQQLKEIQPDLDSIIIRSTVPPGTSERLGTHFMPEFLTEKNWKVDFEERSTWIFGLNFNLNLNKIKGKITKLINISWNEKRIRSRDINFVTSLEAETAKYVRNCFLSVKVSFFNEINEYCQRVNLNYEAIRQLTIDDSRIGSSHTNVPGPDGRYGFGGTCLPKDLAAFINYLESKGVNPEVMRAVQRRNNNDILKSKI